MAGRLADLVRRDLERFRAQAVRNLEAAAELLDDGLRETLAVPYPPASRPGQAPRKRTGRLRRESSAKANTGSMTITLSNAAPYAQYLRPTRPWEDLTLKRLDAQVEEILLDRGYKEALSGR